MLSVTRVAAVRRNPYEVGVGATAVLDPSRRLAVGDWIVQIDDVSKPDEIVGG